MKKNIFLLLMMVSSVVFSSTEELYPFKEPSERLQFQRLLTELRCLVCQNQDLAGSNATLAKDLKNIVYQKVLSKNTDEEIKVFLTERYGDFVLFNPPIKQETYLLWFGPILMLIIALIFLCRFVLRIRSHV